MSNRLRPYSCLIVALASCIAYAAKAAESPALSAWETGVRVRPVITGERHTIHAYFNTSPESPDGRYVVFFASTAKDSHQGEVRIIERATGKERLLADGITTEDAHRVACQQWISGGKRVVYHDVRDNRWHVACVDIATGESRVLISDRQLGYAAAAGNLVPVYGCHWNPGEHRDLELVNAETGQVTKSATAAAVRETFSAGVEKIFGDKPISVFFPVLSPDSSKVFFKLATPGGGDFRSKAASMREGLVGYDLTAGKLLFFNERWGHPAWHPESNAILQVGHVLIDATTGKGRRIPDLPGFKGSHPSVSPDGRLFVTDTTLTAEPGQGQIVVGAMDGTGYSVVHKMGVSRGARSWRVSHAHPVFSADSKRIYFNVNEGQWTELYVAECGAAKQ